MAVPQRTRAPLLRALAAVAIAAAVGALGAPAAAQAAPPVELVVEFAPGTTPAERAAALDAAGLELVEPIGDGDFAVVLGPPGTAPGGAIAGVERPVPVAVTAVPNDPQYANQWHLPEVQAPEAWEVADGSGVVVAVVDTGIATDAPDLAGTSFTAGWDFVDEDADPDDPHGHGTIIAGVIAQTTGEGYGAAGLAPGATLMPLRVLDAQGRGYDADIAEAIHWAVEHGADVINMSLGGPSSSTVLQRAVAEAAAAGLVVVAAAGNDGGPVRYPAAYPDVIGVGATQPGRSIASFSNRGTGLDLVAPGVRIVQQGPRPGGGWCWCSASGTSLAAPQVAAAAALLLDAGVPAASVRDALESSALDLGATGWDGTFGHGLLQVAGALAVAGRPAGGTDPTAPQQQVQDLDDACPASVPRGRFPDVDPASVHARAVDCVAWLGFAGGQGDGGFAPGSSVTRAQMATFLAKLLERAGVTLPDAPPDAFDDDEGSPHEAAIDALAALGVVRGTGDRQFSPAAPVSRAAMATFLATAHDAVATHPLPDAADTFDDDDGNVHEAAIDRLAAAGIATGTANRIFDPGTAVSRAQMATFVARTFDALVDAGDAARPA